MHAARADHAFNDRVRCQRMPGWNARSTQDIPMSTPLAPFPHPDIVWTVRNRGAKNSVETHRNLASGRLCISSSLMTAFSRGFSVTDGLYAIPSSNQQLALCVILPYQDGRQQYLRQTAVSSANSGIYGSAGNGAGSRGEEC